LLLEATLLEATLQVAGGWFTGAFQLRSEDCVIFYLAHCRRQCRYEKNCEEESMGFWDRMEDVLNQGVESSKEMLGKAKEKAKDLGEKGVLKYEIMQLDKQAEHKLVQLGSRVFEKLVEKQQNAVTKEGVQGLLQDIQDLRQRIEEKEEAYKRIGQ
jgi:hypothetical protein